MDFLRLTRAAADDGDEYDDDESVNNSGTDDDDESIVLPGASSGNEADEEEEEIVVDDEAEPPRPSTSRGSFNTTTMTVGRIADVAAAMKRGKAIKRPNNDAQECRLVETEPPKTARTANEVSRCPNRPNYISYDRL